MAEPPQFQMAMRCVVCNSSFSAFRRRHHCRCCGRTLCSEHSSKQIPLPQFAIPGPVRVCDDCFNKNKQSLIGNSQTGSADFTKSTPKDERGTASNGVTSVTDSIDNLDLDESTSKSTAQENYLQSSSSSSAHFECKCGMPLCICKPPEPPETQPTIVEPKVSYHPKKMLSAIHNSSSTSSKSTGSSSVNTKTRSFFTNMKLNDSVGDKHSYDYDVNGEGLREAIKNGDMSAVKELLTKGVDANYCDKQGMSLLHLATVFNHSDIAFLLMDAGARVDAKNAQGETPVDCAQTMLQYKMREKMQNSLVSE